MPRQIVPREIDAGHDGSFRTEDSKEMLRRTVRAIVVEQGRMPDGRAGIISPVAMNYSAVRPNSARFGFCQPAADALIVGSDVKRGGVWSGALDEARVRALADAFNTPRSMV